MDNLEQVMRESYKQVQAERNAEPEVADEGIAEQGPVGVAQEVPEQAGPQQPPSTRARDANGRFIEQDAAPQEVEPAKETKAAPVAKATPDQPIVEAGEPSKTAIAPPISWSAQAKAEFVKAPPAVQQEVLRREADYQKGLNEQGTKYAEKARLADEVQSVAAPFAALLQMDGLTPASTLAMVLPTLRVLRHGTAAQKVNAFQQLIRNYGVDPAAVASMETPYEDPALAQINSRISTFEQQQAADRQARQEAETAQTVKQLDAFKTEVDDKGKPKHPYFDEAVPEMVRLVQGGLAKDIATAYDMAVWASPHLRSRMQADQSAHAEAERVAAAKAKAVQASKAAGTRITSSDPQPEGKTTPRTSNELEAEMKRNLQTIKNRG